MPVSRRRHGTVAWRIHYTLLTRAVLVFVAFLWQWNLLGFRY